MKASESFSVISVNVTNKPKTNPTQKQLKLTVKLKRNDWRDRNVAVECSFRVSGEQNRCEIGSIAPTISANFRRINNFEIISQVSVNEGCVEKNEKNEL